MARIRPPVIRAGTIGIKTAALKLPNFVTQYIKPFFSGSSSTTVGRSSVGFQPETSRKSLNASLTSGPMMICTWPVLSTTPTTCSMPLMASTSTLDLLA